MYTNANAFSREISRHYDSFFEDLNLTTSYIELLLILSETGKCSQKELADRMMLAPSTITRFISKLEKRELVEKKRDGKQVMVLQTQSGLKMNSEIKKRYKKADKALESAVGERFLETTNKLLKFGADQLCNSE